MCTIRIEEVEFKSPHFRVKTKLNKIKVDRNLCGIHKNYNRTQINSKNNYVLGYVQRGRLKAVF